MVERFCVGDCDGEEGERACLGWGACRGDGIGILRSCVYCDSYFFLFG